MSVRYWLSRAVELSSRPDLGVMWAALQTVLLTVIGVGIRRLV